MGNLFVLILFLYGVFGDELVLVSVMEGDSVTLHTDISEEQSGDVIDWRFGPDSIRIARVNKAANTFSYDDYADGRFTDKLNISQQTGDLMIKNIRTTHSGRYKLSIPTKNIQKIFNVTVLSDTTDGVITVPVMVGDSVTLHTDVPEIQRYHVIQWIFEQRNIVLYTLKKSSRIPTTIWTINAHNTGPFFKKLELDHETGSLKIKNIRTELCGIYHLQMISSTHTIHKRFNITVFDAVKSVSVVKGDSVTLHTDVNDVYDQIQWVFENDDLLIAEINKMAQTFFTYIYDGPDNRFRDRLKVDDQTGSLTITNIIPDDAGLYHLEISSSRHTLQKSFIVTVCDLVRTIKVTVGESVTLDIGIDKIHMYDQLLWKFEDEDIVLSKFSGMDQTFLMHDDGIFTDRILYHKDGSLTIKNIGTEHSGFYHLEIRSIRHTLIKRYDVSVIAFTVSDLYHPGYIAVLCVTVVLLVVIVGWVWHCHKISRRDKKRKRRASEERLHD